jgi:hypothetical protein
MAGEDWGSANVWNPEQPLLVGSDGETYAYEEGGQTFYNNPNPPPDGSQSWLPAQQSSPILGNSNGGMTVSGPSKYAVAPVFSGGNQNATTDSVTSKGVFSWFAPQQQSPQAGQPLFSLFGQGGLLGGSAQPTTVIPPQAGTSAMQAPTGPTLRQIARLPAQQSTAQSAEGPLGIPVLVWLVIGGALIFALR